MKKQKGYTLVEFIIVFAIMAILTGASVASIGMINQAKYNSSISSFKNNLSGLWIKTKALSQAKEQAGTTTSTVEQLYPICMRLQKNDNDAFLLVLGYHADDGFVVKNADENDAKHNYEILELPRFLTVEFEPETPEQVASNIGDSAKGTAMGGEPVAMIEFNKQDGSVRYGAGTYKFIYKDREVGSVKLDAATGKQNTR